MNTEFTESIKELFKKVKDAERQLVIDFGVNEPQELVNKNFMEKFNQARTRWNHSIAYESEKEIESMAYMMLRAYKALRDQLDLEQVSKIPVNTWIVDYKGTKVLICKQKEQVKKVKNDYGKDLPIFSAEELINCIPEDVFNFRNKLDYTFDEASISKIAEIKHIAQYTKKVGKQH
jgi:hypothetical protein